MEFVIPLVTVFASGVVAAVTTYTLNSTKEHVFHRRQKGEDLFKAFIGFSGNVDSYPTSNLNMFSGKLSFEHMLEVTTTEQESGSFRDLKMLVGIYFKDLAPDLSDFLAARDAANAVLRKPSSDYREDPKSLFMKAEARRELAQEILNVRKEAAKFEGRIIAVAGDVAAPEALQPMWWRSMGRRIKSNRAIPLE